MPVVHLVLLKISPAADVAAMMSELRGLVQPTIPGLLSFSGGSNSSKEGLDNGYTHAFSMVFESAAARDAYLPHPEHERVKKIVLSCLAEGAAQPVCVCDIEI